MDKKEQKMSFDEYKEKYTRPENTKAIKFGLFMFIASVGLIVFACLLLVVLRVFEINEYAGYVAIGVAVLMFIFLYIVPVVQIHKHRPFITNVNNRTVRNAQRHNRQVRNEISDMMIEFVSKVEGMSWYDENLVGKFAIARQTGNDTDVKSL